MTAVPLKRKISKSEEDDMNDNKKRTRIGEEEEDTTTDPESATETTSTDAESAPIGITTPTNDNDADADAEMEEMKTDDRKRIPVTILSGFLGSGKTTLLKYILTSKDHGLKIAVIVNDMAELNIDGQTILRTTNANGNGTADGSNSNSNGIIKTKKEVVTLENGCICCTLRGDLIREINRIRKMEQFDYVLIESTGIAEPQQVAESFCVDPETQRLVEAAGVGADIDADADVDAGNEHEHEHETNESGKMLWDTARLDTCVTVVDALNFPTYMKSLKRFKDVFTDGLDDAEEQEGEKSISELMVEQVEFANVILLNKIDLIQDEQDVQLTKKLIQSLNPKAVVISSSYGKIDLTNILNTHLFSMKEAEASPGWLVSLKDGVDASSHEGEADEYGVTSFIYRERKPFHPKRLHAFLSQFFSFAEDWAKSSSLQHQQLEKEKKADSSLVENKYGSILRSKGTCWIAGRDDHEMGWSQAGRIIQINPTSPWYCKTPRDEWDGRDESEEEEEDGKQEQEVARIESLFYHPQNEGIQYEYGDRRQEIVLIGTKLQKAAIEEGLNECLLTDEEMKDHTACLPVGTYPDPLHPILVDCQGSSSLFMIARPGQNQHIHIFPGFKLSLQNIALHIDENEDNDDDVGSKIKAVKVWLDKSDSVKRGVLLTTLRPDTHESYSPSLELMPCDVEGGEEDTHRRIRVEVIPRRGTSLSADKLKLMESCEVHFAGKVEPIPYSEGMDDSDNDGDDEDEEDDGCPDGTCPQ